MWFFLRKLRSSRGDSVLVPAMISSILVIALAGLVMDMSKNFAAKDTFSVMAQQSANASVKTADHRGSLNWDVLPVIEKEYKEQKFGKEGTADAVALSGRGGCNTAMIDLSGDGNRDTEVKLPYYKVTLETGRGVNSDPEHKRMVHFTEGQTPHPPELSPGVKYTSVNVVVYDSVSNFVLSMVGMPCQTIESNVSSITFGSMEDVLKE